MGHPLILLQNDEGFLYKLTEGNKELAEKMFNMAKKVNIIIIICSN